MSKDLFDDDGDFDLPNAREVNKQLRAEAKELKAAERSRKVGQGRWEKRLRLAQQKHAGDPKRQLVVLLQDRDIPAAIGRRRVVGDRRFESFGQHMLQFIGDLPKVRAPIKNLSDLGRAHVLALARRWDAQGLGEGTVSGYFCNLRRYFCLVGKPDMVPTGDKLREWLASDGIVTGTVGRQIIPNLSKGWRSRGVEPLEIIARVRLADELVACQLEMMLAFGLRVSEALQIQPADADQKESLSVTKGTKGGKPRTVRISSEPEKAAFQREVLQRAKELARSHPRDELAPRGLNREQARTHFNETMRQYKVTQAGLGVTPHGLRHQFGLELFRELTGMPAPVLGELPAKEYQRHAALVDEGMREVSRQMGHERKDISFAYIGSIHKLGKAQKQRLVQWLDQLGSVGPVLADAEAVEAWMTGTCGRGSQLRPGEPMHLAVRLHEKLLSVPHSEVVARLVTVRKAAEAATKLRVVVSLWDQPAMPDEATEVLFAYGVQRKSPPAGASGGAAGDGESVGEE